MNTQPPPMFANFTQMRHRRGCNNLKFSAAAAWLSIFNFSRWRARRNGEADSGFFINYDCPLAIQNEKENKRRNYACSFVLCS